MWLYYGEPVIEDSLSDFIGFVYIITNLDSGRQYIGKKLLKFKRTKTVKGKKKKILVDSDWKTYWGSNKVLIEEVQSLGQDKYIREIVRLCKSKGELNYFEAKYQFTMGALESERFYNEWVSCKIHKVHLKKVDFSST
jgi:hypothetical protein